MKKIIVLLTMAILLVSCGENEELKNGMEVPVVDIPMIDEIDAPVVEEILSEDEINAAMDELFNSLED